MRPFCCPVTILNTLDSLGSGPTWFFDIGSVTRTMNYQPITTGSQTNPSAGFQDKFDAEKAGEEIDQQYVLFLVWSFGSTNPQNNDGDAAFDGKEHDFDAKKPESEVSVSPSSNASQPLDDPDMPELEDITYSDDEDDVGTEADFNNLETSITVSPIPTTRVHKDHPISQIIGDLSSTTQTRSMTRVVKDQCGLSQMFNDDFHTSDERQVPDEFIWELTFFLGLQKIYNWRMSIPLMRIDLLAMQEANTCDLSTHTTKYTSPALTQKVFANMRRVGKGFSRVGTPLFEGMLVEQEIDEEGDADEHVEEVNTRDAAEGDYSVVHGEVATVVEEQSIPSPTPPTPPPQPPQVADFPMSLLQKAMDACAAFTRRVEHLEYDKVAQALEITKLKMRVKKLEKRSKVRVLKLRKLQKVGTSQRVKTSNTVMDDESNQRRMIAEIDHDDAVVLNDDKEEDKEVADVVKDVKEAKVDESAQDQERKAKSQAKIYKIDMDHSNKVLSMQEDKTEPAEVQEVVDVVTTAKLITKVVIASSETVNAASAIITTAEAQVLATTTATLTASLARVAAAPKDHKPLKKKQQIKKDEQYAKELHVELNKDIDWDKAIDHVKRKAKEDLANVAGFKMDYFKEMFYDDIHPIFEAKFNQNVAFLLKTKEQIEEDENKALQKINETPVERAAKRRKLDEKVEDLKRHLQIVPN
nr:hypothetical protein [Tanacetum cinerariifolium]